MIEPTLAPAPDFSLCRLVPVTLQDGSVIMSPIKDHAKVGVRAMIANPFFFITDEMGGMKTAQAIVTAQFLYLNGIIDNVLVIAPSAVRPVWFDPELGELVKHLFLNINASISEYHARSQTWIWGDKEKNIRRMRWIVTNYEFIRFVARAKPLVPYCTKRTLLICDETTAIKSHKSKQFKMSLALRKKCGRVIELNGTPIANNPLDLFTQGQMMDSKILSAPSTLFPLPIPRYSFFTFRARYAKMGGWNEKAVIGWKNLEDLQERFSPYILRRLKRDCLDLPPALPPVILTVTLQQETWRIYKQMRDEMVAWLSDGTVAVASQAAVKTMRLAQITSGFLGGIQDAPTEDDVDSDGEIVDQPVGPAVTKAIGREKLDFLLEWHRARLQDDSNLKLVVWSRFIPELSRMLDTYKIEFPTHRLGCCAGKPLLGGKKKDERSEVLRLLDPRTAPPGPVTVGGTYGTGSLGHNFTASHMMVNMSSDYSPWKESQAAARIDRPGQVYPTSYFDIVAVGPDGQKTIDHIIVKARRGKEDVATWTCSAWIRALTEE